MRKRQGGAASGLWARTSAKWTCPSLKKWHMMVEPLVDNNVVPNGDQVEVAHVERVDEAPLANACPLPGLATIHSSATPLNKAGSPPFSHRV